MLGGVKEMNGKLYEGGVDLGGSGMEGLWKVIIGEMGGGMVRGLVVGVRIWMEDFGVRVFRMGNEGVERVCRYIYGDGGKGGVRGEVGGVWGVIFVVIVVVVIIIKGRGEKGKNK